MNNPHVASPTGDAAVDRTVRGFLDVVTLLFPERVRACYLTGSRAVGPAVRIPGESLNSSDVDQPWCGINNLAVKASWRRQGIGRALVRAAEEWAQRKGLTASAWPRSTLKRGGVRAHERFPGPRADPDRAGDAGAGDGGHVSTLAISDVEGRGEPGRLQWEYDKSSAVEERPCPPHPQPF